MAGNRHDHDEQEVRLPDPGRPEGAHEESDVNVWGVGKVGIALVLVCIAAVAGLVGLFRYFQSSEQAQQAPLPAGLNVDARRLPPQPRLQSAPILDLREMRAAEDRILNSYGWLDEKQGLVRIPIGRAIDLLAQRGLPTRPQSSVQTAAADVSVPTESGLGPKMIQPGGPLK